MSESNNGLTNEAISIEKGRDRVFIYAVIVFILVAGTVVYFGSRTMRDSSADASTGGANSAETAEGLNIYQARCAMCHQDNGLGVNGAYPPLVGSEQATGDPERMISIILHGMVGPATVKGVQYNGVMPGMKDIMSSEDIAVVATFVRSSWGNKAAAVNEGTVEQVRKKTAARTTPWTAEEVAKMK